MKVRWLWKVVVRDMYEGKRGTFGLDQDEIGIMETEYVVEHRLDERVISSNKKFSDNLPLPWYIMEDKSILARMHQTAFEIMTCIVVILTPLLLVDDEFKDRFRWYEFGLDCLWFLLIILNFFTATRSARTL